MTIAANTLGLCLELARAGASVVACEPDPYRNTRGAVEPLLRPVIQQERLELELRDEDFFSTHLLDFYDETIVICYGIIYHFRAILYSIEYKSSLPHSMLFFSTQTHPGDELALYNRRDQLCGGVAEKVLAISSGPKVDLLLVS